jgi:hypothetical protein
MQDIRKEPGRDGTGEKFADPVSDDRRPELLAQLKAEYISADLASRPQLFHCSRAADPTYPDRWKSSVGWPVATARRASGLRKILDFLVRSDEGPHRTNACAKGVEPLRTAGVEPQLYLFRRLGTRLKHLKLTPWSSPNFICLRILQGRCADSAPRHTSFLLSRRTWGQFLQLIPPVLNRLGLSTTA